MEKLIYFMELTQKNSYFFLTKFMNLAGCIFLILLIYIGDLNSEILFILSLGLLFFILQVGYSRLFPHKVSIYDDQVEFIGPWKIGKQNIKFSKIKSIESDDVSMKISPEWPGLNPVYILKSLDPDKNIQNRLLNCLKDYSHINYIKKNN